MEPLASTSEVIDALGGTAAVARLTGRTMQAVSNWRERGFFTAAAYEPINKALNEAGLRASLCIWKSLPPSALTSQPERAA